MARSVKMTVLCIDDTKTPAWTRHSKMHVQFVRDGFSALEELQQRPVGAVLVAYSPQRGRGTELLEQLRQQHPEIPRLAVACQADTDAVMRANASGLLSRHLIKPCTTPVVHKMLLWALEIYTWGEHDSAVQKRIIQTERLVTLGTLGAAVTHDLNQPLSYLQTNAERLVLLARAMPALAELLRKHGHTLSHAHAANLADLSQELSDIGHDMVAGCDVMHGITQSMQRLLHPSTDANHSTDPIPVVRYALSACQRIALRGRAVLAYDGPTQLPKLRIGATELTQILINVVANGAQALCRRDAPGGRLWVRTTEQRGTIRFVVKDDGPGMSAEVLAQVGTPFFSTRTEGTGLGVSQCRRLVERQGGKFQIESREGIGTTVSFTLPKASDDLACPVQNECAR